MQSTILQQPLQLAILNQVDFHLHVVAGAMHVLQPLTSAPVSVYLTDKVLNHNHFGFMEWLGSAEGFEYKDCAQIKDNTAYDLVWLISPEWDISWTEQVLRKMQYKVALLYVHNGHMPDADFSRLRRLSPHFPLLTMSPHVADYVSNRLQQASSDSDKHVDGAASADWVLPIWPYQPSEYITEDTRQDAQRRLKGFSISGSMDPSLRDYSKMWQQIRTYKEQQGQNALQHFQLNILGDMFAGFEVPDDLQQLVSVYKTPPDSVFYDVVYHSYGIVPALANPAYYTCKLTSAVITSLMSGVPVIADTRLLEAYRMMKPTTVYHQKKLETELDVMFRVLNTPLGEVLATRAAVEQLRLEVNERAVKQLAGWLQQAALVPDSSAYQSRKQSSSIHK
eukprot:gene6842-7060_t